MCTPECSRPTRPWKEREAGGVGAANSDEWDADVLTSCRDVIIQAPSPVGQVGLKGRLLSGRCAQIVIRIGAEKMRHVPDGPRVPPLDVAVRGLGRRGVIHPRVHGDLDVGVSDGRETCRANGLRS